MEITCPCCAAKLNLDIAVLPQSPIAVALTSKSQYAGVRSNEKNAKPAAPKFHTHTDTGKLRAALMDAGFDHEAVNGTIFNDVRESCRRLKLWQGERIASARQEQFNVLRAAIMVRFGNERVQSINIRRNVKPFGGRSDDLVVKLQW